jgi:hypothetical protein
MSTKAECATPTSGSGRRRFDTIALVTAAALNAAPSGAPGRFRCSRQNLSIGSRRHFCSRYPSLTQLVMLGFARCAEGFSVEAGSVVKSAPYDRIDRFRGKWWRGLRFGESQGQASCLEIEGPRTSPKSGAPNDRQGHQSVTPATDRGRDDPPAWPRGSASIYPPRQKPQN